MLIIPKHIRTGFRAQPFQSNLSYTSYYDAYGKLHREKSWKSWCDPNIPYIDSQNMPSSGFCVLSNKIGGCTNRQISIRIKHPLDYEFEISVENLLWLMQYTSIDKMVIQTPCVIGFNNGRTWLVPITAPEYKECTLQFQMLEKDLTIKANALIPGHIYQNAAGKAFVFMGKHTIYTPTISINPDLILKYDFAKAEISRVKPTKNAIIISPKSDSFNRINNFAHQQIWQPSAKPYFVWYDMHTQAPNNISSPKFIIPRTANVKTSNLSYTYDKQFDLMLQYEYIDYIRITANCPTTIVKDFGMFADYDVIKHRMDIAAPFHGIDYSRNTYRQMTFDEFRKTINKNLFGQFSQPYCQMYWLNNGQIDYTPAITVSKRNSQYEFEVLPIYKIKHAIYGYSTDNKHPLYQTNSLQELYDYLHPIVAQYCLNNGSIVSVYTVS